VPPITIPLLPLTAASRILYAELQNFDMLPIISPALIELSYVGKFCLEHGDRIGDRNLCVADYEFDSWIRSHDFSLPELISGTEPIKWFHRF
jgi:hypothetical protein